MALSADIIRLVLTALVSALIGGLAGYGLAWYRLQQARLNLVASRRLHRQERLVWHRERYQESTSRIHRPSDSRTDAPEMSNEALEQLRLEMTILREDHRIETQLLREENEELRDAVERARTAEATFTDLPAEEPALETSVEEVDSAEPVEASIPSGADLGTDTVEEAVEVDEKPAEEMEETREHLQTAPAAADEPDAAKEEEAPSTERRSIPDDIKALLRDNTIREKLFKQPLADTGKPASPKQKPEKAIRGRKTGKAHEVPAKAQESPAQPIPDKPSAGDAHRFHFHWGAPRKAAVPRKRQPVEGPRLDMPAFRSLYDMLQASGVSLSPDPVTPGVQDHDPVHRIVGLDRESYALLVDLGYASLQQLATLTEAETRRLAAVFRISPERIRQEWTPSARGELQGNHPSGKD